MKTLDERIKDEYEMCDWFEEKQKQPRTNFPCQNEHHQDDLGCFLYYNPEKDLWLLARFYVEEICHEEWEEQTFISIGESSLSCLDDFKLFIDDMREEEFQLQQQRLELGYDD